MPSSAVRPMPATYPEPSSMSSRTWWVAIAFILAVAFALRLLYLNQVAALPFFDQPTGDSAVYLRRAREIASGVFLPTRPFFYGSIFYPYFLAVVLALANGNPYWACLSQITAGVGLIALLAIAALRLYGPVAGIAAGAIAAFYGPFAFLEADLLGVVWGLVALALGILACEVWQQRSIEARSGNGPWLYVAGLAIGLAAVERPNLVLLIPVTAAWCAVHAPQGRARSASSFLAASLVPLALVTTLNVAGTGQWVPLTTSAGINLSIGYHPGAAGTYEEPWENEAPQFAAQHPDLEEASITMASMRVGHPLTPQQASAYWQRLAMQHIRSHPSAAIAVTFRKALLLLNSTEIPNHLDFLFIRDRAPALWFMPISFGAVLSLAVLGVFFSIVTGRRRPETLLVLLLATGAMLSVVPFFVADRYRIPIVPPLIIAAGAGVAMLVRFTQDPLLRTDRRALAGLVAASLVAAITLVPLARPLMGHDYWMLAQAYQADGNLAAAVGAYEAAVRVEGKDAALLNNLATAYRETGRRDRAIAAFRRAIEINPRLALPHKNLGMMLIASGDMSGALPELREAFRLDSGDAQTLGAIGALLAERGDDQEAVSAFSGALRLAPGDRRIVDLLSHYPAVARRVPAGLTAGGEG
jgi:Flp pilus assembly protein TadD